MKPDTKASPLETAIQIAVQAHAGQKEKNGQPFILHSLRVMGRVQSEEEKIVAVVHDVIEDARPSLRWVIDRPAPGFLGLWSGRYRTCAGSARRRKLPQVKTER